MNYTKEYTMSTITNSRSNKVYECEQPQVGLVFKYGTCLMSQGHDYTYGYIVTKIYNKKGTDLTNKADAVRVVGHDKQSDIIDLDYDQKVTILLSQSGRWYMKNGSGSDPYVCFGVLQLPWTEQEQEEFRLYALGN